MLVIGATYADIKGFSLGAYNPEGRNVGTVQVVAGGVCRNVAEDLAKLGMEVDFVSLVDETSLGEWIKNELKLHGLKMDHVFSAENGMGIWLAVLGNDGSLQGSISQQPCFDVLERYLYDYGEALVANTDGVVLEFDMNERIACHILELAEKYKKPIYAIVANMGVILRHPEYLKKVTCFICNEIEAGQLLHEELSHVAPEVMLSAIERYSSREAIRAMVVTMGGSGSVYVDNDARASGYCPALSVEVIDTTGAGDAFFSTVVASLTRGKSLAEAVCDGTEVAARTVQNRGSTWKS